MSAILLVALAVGLDNFAAATALGVSGVDSRLRLRVAAVFGVFEGVMPVVGLLLGRSLAHDLGRAARPVAGSLLGLAGAYAITTALLGEREVTKNHEMSARRLLVIGAALSIDNLVVGFALGTYHVALVVAAVVIATVSVALSLVGLQVGEWLGGRLGNWSEIVGGAILVLVGVGIAVGLL